MDPKSVILSPVPAPSFAAEAKSNFFQELLVFPVDIKLSQSSSSLFGGLNPTLC